MGDAAIFLIGVVVTVLVLTAFVLLLWAEVQDGRTQRAAERGEPHDLSETDGERPMGDSVARRSMSG
jgi:hypothetical protein